MRLVKTKTEKQRGVVLVEFAMVLPLLTFLLMGVFYFGILLREHQILQNAAREGARYSILFEAVNDVPGVQAVVTNYLAQEGITVDPSDVAVDQNVTLNFGGVIAGGTRVTVSYSRSLPLGTALFGPVTLKGQAVFRNLY